ncbi:hypothetical protein [Streptomyces sp. CAU 1734]|uniref:hypothetical protein n=1 Tax=Streptomyces sp. CAU 1734 TaxID=3140360 RepID=UPI0032615E9E
MTGALLGAALGGTAGDAAAVRGAMLLPAGVAVRALPACAAILLRTRPGKPVRSLAGNE